MAGERDNEREGFLGRWSRRKTEAREQPAAEAPVAVRPVQEEPAPELPPVEKLTLDSDFSGFFHPKVDEDVRRAALRKLFSDPHFNVMDGLDVYIDDYSKSEPIPVAMLASLKQAQRILEWAADKGDNAAEEGAQAPAEAGPAARIERAAADDSAAQSAAVSAADPVPVRKT